MVQLNFDAVKEPRGFMKVLQFFFAILAFATTTSFSTYFTFHAKVVGCNGTEHTTVRQEVSYPFRLDSVIQEQQLCDEPGIKGKFHYQTDTSSNAEFFVAIGVVCMLFSVAALAGYSLYGDRYTESGALTTADFIIHGLLAFLWLAAASAWAAGASTLKGGCDPELWLSQVCNNQNNVNVDCSYEGDDFKGSFGKLNISLLFGFLNTFLWASNMWFLYKETPWFRGNQAAAPPAGDVGNI